MFKKKIIFLIIIFVLAFCITGCSSNNKNTENSSKSTEVSTDKSQNSVKEDNVSKNTTNNKTENSERTTEEKKDTETKSSYSTQEGVMTNKEFVRLICNSFEIYSDESFEDDVEQLKFWNWMDEDTKVDPDKTVSAEFLVSVTMKATGFVEENATLDEILECAARYGVIESAKLSAVNTSNAKEIVKAAKHAYLHPDSY